MKISRKMLRLLVCCSWLAVSVAACAMPLSGYPADIKAAIQATLDAAPFGRGPELTLSLPPPDKRFSEVHKFLNEAAELRLDDKYQDNSGKYIGYFLFFDAYEEAERIAEKIKTLKAKTRLARYFSIHGVCKDTKSLADEVLKQSDSYVPLDAISALELCGFHDRAAEIIRQHPGSSAKYIDIGPFAKNETEEQFQYRQKIEFIADAYSQMGIDFVTAGDISAANEYIQYAESIILSQKGDARIRAYRPVYVNLLQAGLLDEAFNFLQKVHDSALNYKDTHYLSKAYGLAGRADKVFEIAKQTTGLWDDTRSGHGMIAPGAIEFLTKRNASPAYLDQLEETMFQHPYKEAENVNAFIELAVANAWAGRKDRADRLIQIAQDDLNKFFKNPVLSNWESRAQSIAEAYVLIDKNPYRAFEFLTDKKYFRGVQNNQSWGYAIGAANMIGDQLFLEKIDGYLRQESSGPVRYDFYHAGEVEYLIKIGEFEKALSLLQLKEVEGYKEHLLVLLAFQKAGVSQQELYYRSNIEQ